MDSLENKTEKAKPQELFPQYTKEGKILFIEYEVEKIDYEGFEVVPREMLSQRRTKCRK